MSESRAASVPRDGAAPPALLTLAELTHRVGMSVRTVRFYTTRGLVPPPIRRGRSGYYSAEHVARLELVQELRSHGYTLTAIEGFLAGIPGDASPGDIALHRTMLAPWQAEQPVVLSTEGLAERAGHELTGEELETLAALGIIRPGPTEGTHDVAVSQLSVGLSLLELGFPIEAARAAADVYAAHGRAIAQDLRALFREMVWPAYRDTGSSPERLQDLVERLKPLSVASLVTAYETAMADADREDTPQDR